MTANQINYQNMIENVRHNLASEKINRAQAAAASSQAESAARNAETNALNAQTNLAKLSIDEEAVGAQWYGAMANRAYQEAMAAVSQANQAEAVRHNTVSEKQDLIKAGINADTERYKADVQARTSRTNTQETNKTSERNVDVQTSTSTRNTDVEVRGGLLSGLISGLMRLIPTK